MNDARPSLESPPPMFGHGAHRLVPPLGPADDDALAAALGAGPELVYRAVEAE